MRIHDNALVAAATLSNRYITARFLPDKAIDLVDEACAMIRTEIDSMPSALDDLRRRIMQMEIEEMALKKEDDQLSRDRLAKLTQALAELKDSYNAACTPRAKRSSEIMSTKSPRACSTPTCRTSRRSSRKPRLRPSAARATTPSCTTP